MKFTKYLLTLAFAFCAFTSVTKAQATVAFLGGGSSALFQELGSASQSIPGVSCLWTYTKTSSGGTPYIAATDPRPGVGLDEGGQVFIAWGPGSGTCAAPAGSYSIYAYIQLDSVIGNRCYFIADGSGQTGCTLKLQNTAGIVGKNVITTNPDTPVNITVPASVAAALIASPHFFVGGTDIRPEDAKFATQRMFTPCNQLMPRQYFNQDSYYTTGLGYGSGNVGTAILGNASFGGGSFNVVNFNITGNDPINTTSAVPAYSVSTIGAQPIVVAVAPTSDAQVAAMTDINGFTLTLFYQGVLGRTSDLLGPTGAPEAITTLVREPLSGTYNTFEYSIPNGTQYHASQEYGNCDGSGNVLSNPMALNNGNGVFGSASQRVRAIGTGNVTKFLQLATTPTLGYFFWSAGNAQPETNVKYLKVNGVDPLLDSVTAYNGVLPGTGVVGDPGLAHVGFAGLNAGDYPIWSALRLIGPPGNAGVAAMITALNVISSTQHDYIAPNNLKVWHSHFFINNQSIPVPANGATVGSATLCSGGTAESGGDAGGTNMLIINNAHFCSDYGATNGLLNKTQ